jgi:hypothetical protein
VFDCYCSIGLGAWFSGVEMAHTSARYAPYIEDAQHLVIDKQIPESGVLTSFGSYTPPGLSWLFAPGVLMFSDVRLADAPGRALLYVGTLLGVYFLARVYFNEGCALLAAAIYALSELGLQSASVLYDRLALDCFYVWIVYWAVQWVRKRNSKFLAIAVLIYIAGIYVFPEIAPTAFVFATLWVFYRPPIRIAPLAIVALLGLLITFPYIRFEQARHFADLKSMATRQRMLPTDYRISWCDPTVAFVGTKTSFNDGFPRTSNADVGNATHRRGCKVLPSEF